MHQFAKLGLLSAALCSLIYSAPTQAQDLGVEAGKAIATALFHVADQNSCITGHNPFAKGTTARMKAMSEDSLATYLRLSGAGSSVDVRPAFSTKKVTLSWSRDGQPGDVGAVTDPLAQSLATTPNGFETRVTGDQFLIAGDKFSTMGLWRVLDAADPSKVLGWYRARFWRHNPLTGQTWDLMTMEVFSGPTEPAKVVQYCSEPGDVERHAIEVEQERAERARRKAEKSRTR